MYFDLDMLSLDNRDVYQMVMSNKHLGRWDLKHGGNVKAGSIDSKILQIEVITEAQGQVTSPGLGDVFRAPTRDEIGNPGFYFWQHGALDTVRGLSAVLAERKGAIHRLKTGAV